MAELSKFDELRIKTEDELVQLVNNKLEIGIREAREAYGCTDARGLAEGHYLKAKGACAEVSRLIPLVGEIPQDQRGPWEARLRQLREMLEGLSVLASRHTAADDLPAIARAGGKPGVATMVARPSVRPERALKSQRELQAVGS
jgi:hypothetical protein